MGLESGSAWVGSGTTCLVLGMQKHAIRGHTPMLQPMPLPTPSTHACVSRPGHMTACLTTFQSVIGASIDNWDATFSEAWRTSDLVDCILSYAATLLVKKVRSKGWLVPRRGSLRSWGTQPG